MSIAVEKAKQASERFLLVRLNPARFILPVSIGGGLYEITVPFILNKIELNGSILTKDSSIPTVDDHWYQDETTLTVTVKLVSAPNDTTNILIAYYYLFYTGTKNRVWHEDPVDTATGLREWQPRLLNYPSIIKSFDNIINGVFTISSSTIDIINENGQFQEYLTDDDSFYNKEVMVWLCITDETNIKLIFKGTIASLNFNSNIASINIEDDFSKLKEKALIDDTINSYYTRGAIPAIPNIDPYAIGKPCPYIIGRYSRFTTNVVPLYVSGGPDPYQISEGNIAYCTGYSSNVSNTSNRFWRCARQNNTTALHGINGTVTAVANPIAGLFYVKFNSFDATKLVIGDSLKWVNGVTTYYGRVMHIGAFTYLATSYDIILEQASSTLNIGDVFTSQESFACLVERTDGTKYYPIYGRDYTVVHGTIAASGNKIVSIFFNSAMEANTGMPSPLNPDTDNVIFRTSNSSSLDSFIHDRVLKELLESAGLSVDDTVFLNTQSVDDSRLLFQIPNFDENDYDSYLKYVQDILSSTLGFINVNTSNDVEYHLLESPTSTDERNSGNIIDGSINCSIDYSDIATSLITYNPHNSSLQATEATYTPSITVDNNKLRYLHGIINVDRFRHCYETINGRIDAHAGLKSNRLLKYSFETATNDIDTDLGTDLQLSNKIVIGSSDTQDIKVISIEKSPGSTRVDASDLKGF